MTYREKLRQDNPDWSEAGFDEVVDNNCPYFFYAVGHACSDLPFGVSPTEEMCDTCWDTEIPDEIVDQLQCNNGWILLIEE